MGRIVQPSGTAGTVAVTIDGERVSALKGESIAGLLLARGGRAFRVGVRAPYCGMGTCFGCRVEVSRPGRPPIMLRACVTAVEEGMAVSTTARQEAGA